MLNVFLSFLLFFNNLNFIKMNNTEVEKIEYKTNDNKNNILKLSLVINAYVRDILEIKVYFYDENKNLLTNKYFSSALAIEKREQTIARIPITITNKTYLNIVLFSANLNEEIENIMFPVYPRESSTCDFNSKRVCQSTYPSLISYENGQINEVYEIIGLVNENLELQSFDNFLPIDKIHLIANLNLEEGVGYAKIKEKIEGFDLLYDNEYNFNLNVLDKNKLIYLDLMDKYYLDLYNGYTFQNYKKNSIYKNKVIFPYTDNKYTLKIILNDCFVSFTKVELEVTIETKNHLIGNCYNSKYCVRRNYL